MAFPAKFRVLPAHDLKEVFEEGALCMRVPRWRKKEASFSGEDSSARGNSVLARDMAVKFSQLMLLPSERTRCKRWT